MAEETRPSPYVAKAGAVWRSTGARPLEARQGNERKLRPVRRLLVSTRRRKRLAGRPWSRSIGPFRVSARPAETASFTHKNRRRASRGQ